MFILKGAKVSTARILKIHRSRWKTNGVFFWIGCLQKKKDVGLLEKVVFYFSDGRMSCFFGVGIHISLVKILGTI